MNILHFEYKNSKFPNLTNNYSTKLLAMISDSNINMVYITCVADT